jgi:hypothetical protein
MRPADILRDYQPLYLARLAHPRYGDGIALPESVSDEIYSTVRSFSDALAIAGLNRRLYGTEKGFIGLGPLSTKVSDKVWIFHAAKVPFILRRISETPAFRLVGETYVHGLRLRRCRDLLCDS